jgi:heme exporter protein C
MTSSDSPTPPPRPTGWSPSAPPARSSGPTPPPEIPPPGGVRRESTAGGGGRQPSLLSGRGLEFLAGAGVAGLLIAAAAIFLYAPEDALQGQVQRIFYVHVTSAVAAFGCFGLVAAGGAVHLWRGSLRADRLARAGALVGLVFTTNTIVLGIIWAKPIWNWDPSQTWDARFTSTVVLWMVYAGYLTVRKFAPPGRQAMRLAAVVGIIGFIDVPVVYLSVRWWRTLHPGYVLESPGGPALPREMLYTFVLTMLAMLFFAAVLVAIRYRIEAQADARAARDEEQALEMARRPGGPAETAGFPDIG